MKVYTLKNQSLLPLVKEAMKLIKKEDWFNKHFEKNIVDFGYHFKESSGGEGIQSLLEKKGLLHALFTESEIELKRPWCCGKEVIVVRGILETKIHIGSNTIEKNWFFKCFENGIRSLDFEDGTFVTFEKMKEIKKYVKQLKN